MIAGYRVTFAVGRDREIGSRADLAVLGPGLRVRQTYVAGAAALEH